MNDTLTPFTTIEKIHDDAIRNRTAYIEAMAAAYLNLTGLPPDKVELCEQVKDGMIRWWFQERTP